jgi:hypothetical protein
MARPRIAQGTICLGINGEVQAGEEVPETFINSLGKEEDTDFDRLEDLGLIGDEAPELPESDVEDELEEVTEAPVVEAKPAPAPKAAKKPAPKKPAAKKAAAKKPAAKRKPAPKK